MTKTKPQGGSPAAGHKPADAAPRRKQKTGAKGETPGSKENSPGSATAAGESAPPQEVGGRDGPDPTRYGDWENNGRCVDF